MEYINRDGVLCLQHGDKKQALVQEELLRLAKREREAASEHLNTTLQRERNSTNEERQKAAQLARELQCKEAELKRRDAFCKEQLGRIEQKNAEIYKLTSEQFHEAATGAESQIKRRNTEPLCAGLQSEILKCYQENKHEVLKCSELAKAYKRCVSAAQKVTDPSLPHPAGFAGFSAWYFHGEILSHWLTGLSLFSGSPHRLLNIPPPIAAGADALS
uniref:Coiled-coil-helix-coiled-coil-helix domain containing 6 n=1 Tax=Pelusios castaneus TaxID=367368 RepID=A0A8C8S0G4_9SAUR